jgi:hypothetical protein
MIAMKMARSRPRIERYCRQGKPGREVTASAMMLPVKPRSAERFND